jgi:hypothetical protein
LKKKPSPKEIQQDKSYRAEQEFLASLRPYLPKPPPMEVTERGTIRVLREPSKTSLEVMDDGVIRVIRDPDDQPESVRDMLVRSDFMRRELARAIGSARIDAAVEYLEQHPPKGRPRTRTLYDMQEQDRERKRRFDARVRNAQEKLTQRIETTYNELLRKALKIGTHRQVRAQVEDATIAQFLNSSDTAERAAAAKIKRKLERACSQRSQ